MFDKPFLTLTRLALLGILYSNPSHAVSISSERLIFNEKTPIQIVTLINDQDKEINYTFDWRYYTMDETSGRLNKVDKETKIKGVRWIHSDMIQIQPKSITIPAHTSKKITLSLTPTQEKRSGEYRAHFWAKPVIKEKNASSAGGMNINIHISLSKPVFIQYGTMAATAEINDFIIHAKDNDNEYLTEFTLTHDGNKSLYGDIEIFCVNKEEKTTLELLHSVALYTEVKRKQLALDFKIPKNVKHRCNNIQLEYTATKEKQPLAKIILAQAKTHLPIKK